MTTQNIDGIDAAAAANAAVADSVRDRHREVQEEMARVAQERDANVQNAQIAARVAMQHGNDQLGVLNHEYGQVDYMLGRPPVDTGGHHPLNVFRWSLLQRFLAIVLAILGLLFAAVTFQLIANYFGNTQDDWRTVLKIVWAAGWVLIGFGLGGLIGYALDPNNRQQR